MRSLPIVVLSIFLSVPAPAKAMELDQFLAECPKSVMGMDDKAIVDLYCRCLWTSVNDLDDVPGMDPELGLEMLAWNLDKGFGEMPTYPEEEQQAAATMFEYVKDVIPICLQGAVTGKVNPDGTLK